MYQSSSGICLLDRSLNVNLIGQPVKDALAAYPVVTSAVLHPSETTVLFSCMSSGGGASIRLVYTTTGWAGGPRTSCSTAAPLSAWPCAAVRCLCIPT